MTHNNDVLIIGGGIIGVSTAYFLSQQGVDVTLIEKGDIGEGSSYGNAGLLCPCHSTPMPAPGVLSQGLKWMLNPESPFYIKPRLDPSLVGWLWQFQKYCNLSAYHKAVPILRDMQRASLQLYDELIEQEALACHFERTGGLMVFHSQRGLKEAQHEVEEMQGFGLQLELLNREEVHALEPALHANVLGGVHYQEDAHLNPALFVDGLAQATEAKGATLLPQTKVLDFEADQQHISAVHTSQGTFKPKQVVLAAGAWSTKVTRSLGLKFPLQPAKGYSITMTRPANGPKMHLHFSEAKCVATPMGPNLRLAGTLELAGLDSTINQRRVNAIIRAGATYIAKLGDVSAAQIWGGMRPCPPDGLPYIGRAKAIHNLIIATGHAMLGISMGPITGKLVAQMVGQQSLDLPVAAFEVERFD